MGLSSNGSMTLWSRLQVFQAVAGWQADGCNQGQRSQNSMAATYGLGSGVGAQPWAAR